MWGCKRGISWEVIFLDRKKHTVLGVQPVGASPLSRLYKCLPCFEIRFESVSKPAVRGI